MNDVKLTIIAAVYNGETYLKCFLDSVLHQSFRNFQLILVDDGSQDASVSFCSGYAAEDSRIRILTKENGGVSSARNLGLTEASGEYLMLLDSDDYLEPGILMQAVACAEDTKADAVVFSAVYETPDGRILNTMANPSAVYEGKEACLRAFHLGHLGNACWDKLYRRTCLEGKTFEESLTYSEDYVFNSRFFRDCEKAVVLPTTGYHYISRPQSATMTAMNPRKLQVLSAGRMVYDELKGFGSDLSLLSAQYITDAALALYRQLPSGPCTPEQAFMLAPIRDAFSEFSGIVFKRAFRLMRLRGKHAINTLGAYVVYYYFPELLGRHGKAKRHEGLD